jgi:hypothetical protein
MDSDDSVRAAAVDLARAVAAWWRDRLGPDLLGVYLLGSLAHGGFNRRYSDIDIAVIAEEPLPDVTREAMKTHAAAIAPALAPKLSLFWTDRSFSIGRFPPLDRADYLDHGVALIERERFRPSHPTLDEVRRYLGGAPLESWAKAAEGFAVLDRLGAENHKPYLRAHLYPARFAYSWITGRMASNDDAVAFLRAQAPPGLGMPLYERALDRGHVETRRRLRTQERHRVVVRYHPAGDPAIGEARRIKMRPQIGLVVLGIEPAQRGEAF